MLSNSNWTATPRDHYYSAGLGLDVFLIEWTIRDYNYDGFSSVVAIPAVFPFPPGVALLMGGLLPPGYNANVVYVRLKAGM